VGGAEAGGCRLLTADNGRIGNFSSKGSVIKKRRIRKLASALIGTRGKESTFAFKRQFEFAEGFRLSGGGFRNTFLTIYAEEIRRNVKRIGLFEALVKFEQRSS
jgi:hypothetical protein